MKFETEGGRVLGTEGVKNGVGLERKGDRNRIKKHGEVIKKGREEEGRRKRGKREKMRKGEFI